MIEPSEQDGYEDNESFNTCPAQKLKLRKLLSLNNNRLKRRHQYSKKQKLNMRSRDLYTNLEEEQKTIDSQIRLVDNINFQVKKNSESAHTLSVEAEPNMSKFVLNDPIEICENRLKLNPTFYTSKNKEGGSAFNLRVPDNERVGGENSHFIKSTYWNPRTSYILTAKGDDVARSAVNVQTNTRSFSHQFNRAVPKYKIRRSRPIEEHECPKPGYYEAEKAIDKLGDRLKNAVKMDKELPRRHEATIAAQKHSWKRLQDSSKVP